MAAAVRRSPQKTAPWPLALSSAPPAEAVFLLFYKLGSWLSNLAALLVRSLLTTPLSVQQRP